MRALFLWCILLSLSTAAAGALPPPEYPLQVSSDQRTIVDESGEAVLFNADSPWHILVRLNQTETELYLDDRAAKGFNALLVSLLVDDDFSGTTQNAFGEAPLLVPGDFSTPNEAYFVHVDWFLQEAAQRGLTVFLCPAYIGWGCQIEGFCQSMLQNGTSVMREYGRWLGSRYANQPNIIWVHGGDADAEDHGALDVVDAVAEGILDEDPNHLHTGHCDRFTIGSECYSSPWMDFDTVYADCSQTPNLLQAAYELSPPRPLVYIEGRYEFESNWTPQCLRSQAYWSALGGTYGHFFGSGKLWDFPANWQSGLDSEGSVSMQHFRALLQARHWDQLEPDYAHQVLTSGYGDVNGSSYAAAARSTNGETILIYVPTPRPLTVALGQLQGSTAEAWWYDPSTGDASFAGSFPSSGTRAFSPPGNRDWVLVIDDVAANLVDVWNPATATTPSAGRLGVTLDPPSPNPFNPRTQITFSAPAGEQVTVRGFDGQGREVALLYQGRAKGGPQDLLWDARGLASGVYFVRAEALGRQATRKVILIK